MDKLKLSIKTDIEEDFTMHLYAEVKIGDFLLADYGREILAIDLLQLLASLKGDGEYFVITCGCGVPECAGVYNGILVSREKDHINWLLKNFQGNPNLEKAFSFDAKEYSQTIKQGLKEFLRLYMSNPNAKTSPSLLGKDIAGSSRTEWFSNLILQGD
jgi:hypothetical protein